MTQRHGNCNSKSPFLSEILTRPIKGLNLNTIEQKAG